MKEIELLRIHFNILETIDECNKVGLYPTDSGVFKILTGVVDDDLSLIKDIKTFSIAISYNVKVVKNKIKWLIRYGYIKNVYDKNKDRFVLSLTDKGKSTLLSYLKKSKVNHKSKNKKFESEFANSDDIQIIK